MFFFSFVTIIDSVKRRKRVHQEANNGNVFVCASNTTGNSNQESVVLVNNAANMSGKNVK